MGQNLAIGLVTKITISKKNTDKYNVSLAEITESMDNTLAFATDLYLMSDEDTCWQYKIKPDVWESGLLPLLEDAYPLFEQYGGNSDFDKAMSILQKTPPNAFLEISEEESPIAFQFDAYAESEYIYFDKPFKPKVRLGFDAVLLHLCGKVFLESKNGMLTLLTHTLQHRLKHHALAGALRVYITG